MRQSIILNGKFLSAAPTGVHRVAAELGNALEQLIVDGHPAARDLDLEIWAPANLSPCAAEMRSRVRTIRPLTGIPWEQGSLPLRRRTGLLLNLCNIGPMASRRAVTMIHDVQVLLSPASYSLPFRLWYRLVQPVIARRHRHILTVSEYSRAQIVGAGLCRPERVTVVHNGVDHVLRVAADRGAFERLELARGGYVLALATVQAHKNVRILLDAFSREDLRALKLKLVLFGSAGKEDFAAAGLQVPDNAVFAGRVSDAELRGLLESALCLAFPSTTEGFGLPPLEAMVLGCPALVAPCGALPEVCGDGAFYANSDDSDEWADGIVRLHSDPEFREDFVQRGLEQANNFTWREAAAKLAETLSKICNQ